MKMGVVGGDPAARKAAMNMAWAMGRPRDMVARLAHKPNDNSRRRFMKTSILAALLLATAILPAGAQSGPTPQEQMACRSDAGKFCAEHIGKPPQMNACLRSNKPKLSDACRKVVESHGG